MENLLFNSKTKKVINNLFNKIIIEKFNDKIISISHFKNNIPNKFDIKYTESLWKEFINLYYNKMITFHSILHFKSSDNLLNELQKNQFIFICNINEIQNDIKNILRDHIIYNKYKDNNYDINYEII